ncbi:transposase, partial [Streptococcus equi]
TFIKSENLMKNSSVRGIPLNHNYNRFFSYLTDFFKTLSFSIDTSVNAAFKTVFRTFTKYKLHITNALSYPYSNAKLEATNKLIKDIKRQAFGFRNFKNLKTKILIALNITKERTKLTLSRC